MQAARPGECTSDAAAARSKVARGQAAAACRRVISRGAPLNHKSIASHARGVKRGRGEAARRIGLVRTAKDQPERGERALPVFGSTDPRKTPSNQLIQPG